MTISLRRQCYTAFLDSQHDARAQIKHVSNTMFVHKVVDTCDRKKGKTGALEACMCTRP